MEDRLRSLFDYQKFEPNDRLGKLIAATESKYLQSARLSDDDLELVTAAGTSKPGRPTKPQDIL